MTYFAKEKRLLAQDRRFRWDFVLKGLHGRAGFEQDSILSDGWAVAVDIVCVGILVWIGTGIYMWWKLRPTRGWGSLALGGGIALFVMLLPLL